MAGIEAPSFSLGLDLDLDSEPQHLDPNSSTRDTSPAPEDPVGFELLVSDSDLDAAANPSPTFRRLRRGMSAKPKSITEQRQDSPLNVDDDIEEFSSQDSGRSDEHQAVQQQSVCGSSKVSLHECGVLARQAATDTVGGKGKETSSNPSNKIQDKHAFSELIVSPVRRFQLLDSDSDDPSECVDIDRDPSRSHFSKQMESRHGCSASSCEKKSESSTHVLQRVDQWKDFCPERTFLVPTPALDEFCEEYFRAVKDTNSAPYSLHGPSAKREGINEGNKKVKHMDAGCALPPAHRYFFHDNLRIQRLVHSRFPHFWPLAAMGGRGYEQQDASVIDYMGQFGQSNSPKQQHGVKLNDKKTSRRTRKDHKNSNVEEMSLSSGNWVDPRQQASIPKDAGKRRVHANGQSSGHWYTAENGRKVYITRNGQELTGQMAYRQYRKESGAGSRKSKKKSNSKKK
ncbi:hypothetical protein Ancab_008325 [Ancistrocladus abbreviatus]